MVQSRDGRSSVCGGTEHVVDKRLVAARPITSATANLDEPLADFKFYHCLCVS